MKTLIQALGLNGTERVCIIGCGGKTSLMLHLADAFRDRRVLLSTTTHIRHPGRDYCDRFIDAATECVSPLSAGINVLGRIEQPTGKLRSVPPESLLLWSTMSDLTLLEGDGSRGLPLKGWEDFEPVVPDWTSVTIGIVTIWTVGQPVTEEIVFRLPLFSALTAAEAGQPVTIRHIADMVAADSGMFKNAAGRRILLINQIESPGAEVNAARLAIALEGAPIDTIVAGSIAQSRGTILR